MAVPHVGVMSMRFRSLGLNLEPDRITMLIRHAALVHDIGKGADQYQRRLDSACLPTGDKRFSFIFHEVPSAVISWRLCQELKWKEEERILVFLAVLQHSSAMRDWLAKGPIRELEKMFRFWSFHDHGVEISRFMNTHLGSVVELGVEAQEARDIMEGVTNKWLRRHGITWVKLYCFLLAPVVVGDNLDAYEERKDNLSEGRKWFVEELSEALA